MASGSICFSVNQFSAWAPGIETPEAWCEWFANPSFTITPSQPPLQSMPPMLRRRTDLLGKMALETAYTCIGQKKNIPIIFCSRHGEVSRSVEMLTSLAKNEPLSPTSFSLSVHNAIAGLFSIARSDTASNIAMSARESMVENAMIEAYGLLEDGEDKVLLVVYNTPLPYVFSQFEDIQVLPYSWACLIEKPGAKAITLSWKAKEAASADSAGGLPSELEVLRFFLDSSLAMIHETPQKRWEWSKNA